MHIAVSDTSKAARQPDVTRGPDQVIAMGDVRRLGVCLFSLPPVPDRAALAPDRVNSPPGFRCSVARWLEIVDVHTLCFHIRSAFLYKSETGERGSRKKIYPNYVATYIIYFARDLAAGETQLMINVTANKKVEL